MTEQDVVEVLIVEDNQTDLEITLRALRRHNLANKVLAVRDGEEALAYVFGEGKFAGRKSNQHPRVIFLDLKLPKVDGIDVLRAIKGNAATRSIPVVVMTSSAEDRDRIESYRLGVNSYIVKPVEFDSFIKAISEVGLYWLILNHPPRGLSSEGPEQE
jgi:two-component system, response regulator